MSSINDELKETADYAIKTSRTRFKQELDFSNQSIDQLDIILERLYWGFYSQSKDQGESGLVYQTAIIWGSYLGEYMRRKWGGTWILNGKDRLLSIINIDFSPIDLVYQKITTHPEYTAKNYLIESEKIINNTAVISPQPPQVLPIHADQPKKKTPNAQPKKTKTFDKRLIILFASIGSLLLVIVACIGGYLIISTSGVSSFGFLVPATSTSTEIPFVETVFTAAPTTTETSTIMPSPTSTPAPSFTPSQTPTQTAASTPTATITLIIPTRTQTRTPTSAPRNPTKTPVPPTEKPQPTATELPQPTATNPPQPTITQPAPVVIDSCDVNPSTVPVGVNVTITFIVHFSAPGYGFDAEVNNGFTGEGGCSGSDGDGDGVAYCDGSSGELPAGASGNANISSSVGDCVVGFSSR